MNYGKSLLIDDGVNLCLAIMTGSIYTKITFGGKYETTLSL